MCVASKQATAAGFVVEKLLPVSLAQCSASPCSRDGTRTFLRFMAPPASSVETEASGVFPSDFQRGHLKPMWGPGRVHTHTALAQCSQGPGFHPQHCKKKKKNFFYIKT
jgi:hypothetical protein